MLKLFIIWMCSINIQQFICTAYCYAYVLFCFFYLSWDSIQQFMMENILSSVQKVKLLACVINCEQDMF